METRTPNAEPWIRIPYEALCAAVQAALQSHGVAEPVARIEARIMAEADLHGERDIGFAIGLADVQEKADFLARKQAISEGLARIEQVRLKPLPAVNACLADLYSAPLSQSLSLADLLRRPELRIKDIDCLRKVGGEEPLWAEEDHLTLEETWLSE